MISSCPFTGLCCHTQGLGSPVAHVGFTVRVCWHEDTGWSRSSLSLCHPHSVLGMGLPGAGTSAWDWDMGEAASQHGASCREAHDLLSRTPWAPMPEAEQAPLDQPPHILGPSPAALSLSLSSRMPVQPPGEQTRMLAGALEVQEPGPHGSLAGQGSPPCSRGSPKMVSPRGLMHWGGP